MNDNPFAILTDEPVPDSRVGVGDVIAAGRARVRRRRGVVTGVCAALVVLIVSVGVAAAVRAPQGTPSDPAPTPSPTVSADPSGCVATRLPVGEEDIGSAHTDPSGRYLVFNRAPDPGLVVVYRDGVEVQRFSDGQRLQVTAVSSAGTAVGRQGGSPDGPAFRTTAQGTLAFLPKPSGALSVSAQGINAAGDIVGEATMPGKKFRAVLWRHSAPDVAVLLPTPSGSSSAAHDIADDGRIVGDFNQGEQPVLWNADLSTTVLPTPPGRPGGVAQRIAGDWVIGPVNFLAMNGFDAATGRRTGAGDIPPARWHLSAGTVEPLVAPDIFAGGNSVTADGTVLVNRFDGVVRWTGATVTPVPAPRGYDHAQIESVSADGRLLAGAATKSTGGSIEPFAWTCR
ncbi:hypothetical protein ACQEVZ_51510 [Dactylosporangium sp. CA-152071]|uniref:hypothetical protein n=1 Tax=Dactylosporangium sp. CA-152071 TaxID=3239933 RepID=UPI003D9381B9